MNLETMRAISTVEPTNPLVKDFIRSWAALNDYVLSRVDAGGAEDQVAVALLAWQTTLATTANDLATARVGV